MPGTPYQRDGFTNNIWDFAFVARSTVGHLSRRLPLGTDATKIVVDSWHTAYEAGLVVDDGDSVSFPVWQEVPPADGATLPDGRGRLVATLVPNNREDAAQAWFLKYAGPDNFHILEKLEDNKGVPRELLKFAFIPWDKVLSEVSAKALPEPWDFREGDRQVLRSFLTFTYQRAAIQGKVAINAEKGLAAFNTGLVGPTYDHIFMCFRPNDQAYPDWVYMGVCIAGERGLGKELVDAFAPLPERVTYFDEVTDLVFDNTQDLYVDTNHVVVDNVDRLPLAFLKEQLYDRGDLLQEIARLEELGDDFERTEYDTLRDAIEGNPTLLRRFKNRLDDAVELARKRTEWNYRTAVPSYYPKADEMCLLLPLCLLSPNKPDAALVVSLAESGNYQGETVLTMRQAYLDARLICRPENDWLIPE